METEYLTEREVCEWLKVSRSTVINWRKIGLPCVRIERSVRFDRQKVKAWIEQKTEEEGGAK